MALTTTYYPIISNLPNAAPYTLITHIDAHLLKDLSDGGVLIARIAFIAFAARKGHVAAPGIPWIYCTLDEQDMLLSAGC